MDPGSATTGDGHPAAGSGLPPPVSPPGECRDIGRNRSVSVRAVLAGTRFDDEPPLVGKWCGERTREIALTVSPRAPAWEGDCPSSPLDRGSTDSAIARYDRRSLTLRLATSLPPLCRETGLEISTLDTPRHPDPARPILVRQPRSGGYFSYTFASGACTTASSSSTTPTGPAGHRHIHNRTREGLNKLLLL